jgi:hypothetical protein
MTKLSQIKFNEIKNIPQPPFDLIFIFGRSTTYLNTNNDLLNCFKEVNKNLNLNKIFIFDFFDAEDIFLNFKPTMEFIFYDYYGDEKDKKIKKKITRKSNSTMKLDNCFTWDWF